MSEAEKRGLAFTSRDPNSTRPASNATISAAAAAAVASAAHVDKDGLRVGGGAADGL